VAAVGEQVHDLERAESGALREADAAAQRGSSSRASAVLGFSITNSSGGPGAHVRPQAVAEASAGAERGVPEHVHAGFRRRPSGTAGKRHRTPDFDPHPGHRLLARRGASLAFQRDEQVVHVDRHRSAAVLARGLPGRQAGTPQRLRVAVLGAKVPCLLRLALATFQRDRTDRGHLVSRAHGILRQAA
jgi:hypothetical protein